MVSSRVMDCTIVKVLIALIATLDARLGLKSFQQGRSGSLQLPEIKVRDFC